MKKEKIVKYIILNDKIFDFYIKMAEKANMDVIELFECMCINESLFGFYLNNNIGIILFTIFNSNELRNCFCLKKDLNYDDIQTLTNDLNVVMKGKYFNTRSEISNLVFRYMERYIYE